MKLHIYTTTVVYLCSFIISFYVYKNKEVDGYYSTLNNVKLIDIYEGEKIKKANAFERFKYIAFNNEKVVTLNYIGALTLGIGSVTMSAYNGFTFGSYVGVYSNYLSLNDILKYTLPHSFELIAIILSSGEGLYLGMSFCLCFLGYKDIKDINFKKVVSHFTFCTIIILIAAFVESYITMSL